MIKTVHIYGLNTHGISACKLAQKKGINVTASDLKSEIQFRKYVESKLAGFDLTFGSHPETLLERADYVVVSPGVVQNAKMWTLVQNKKNWISIADFTDMVNHWQNPKIIVTGTYGKTTFCTLFIAYMKLLNSIIIKMKEKGCQYS